MNKTLDTLVEDIHSLFNPEVDHVCDEKNLEDLANNIRNLFSTRLAKYNPPTNPLRFSALGKPDRQIWMDAHPDPDNEEKLLPKTYIKFLYGDLLEAMLLFLAKEAGHTVELEQAEVEVDGVKGHIDAKIDGVIVDVKSASPFGYRKFQDNSLLQDDPFGYVQQLSGYASELTPDEGAAWLAIEKVSADICVTPLPSTVINHYKPAERIEELKKVIQNEEPPALCYEPIADGASGNRKLATGCSYCKHKFRCYPDLRVFAYSTGPRFLSRVEKLPNVPEITESFKS